MFSLAEFLVFRPSLSEAGAFLLSTRILRLLASNWWLTRNTIYADSNHRTMLKVDLISIQFSSFKSGDRSKIEIAV
jgi:hypothetical protein